MPYLFADDHARIHYSAFGSGKRNVIFLHCLGGDAGHWTPLLPHLNLEALRCVAIDFRGTGRSQRTPCALTNERLAKDVLQVAEREGMSTFTVVGHSMGAKLALYLAAVRPERIESMVLLGCPSPGLVPIPRELVEKVLSQEDRRGAIESTVRSWFWTWPKPEIDAWLDTFASLPDWAILASCKISLWEDFTHLLRAPFPFPILALLGKHDLMYGPEYFEGSVRPFIPEAMVETIECGHGFMLEEPDLILDCLNRFFTDSEVVEEKTKTSG